MTGAMNSIIHSFISKVSENFGGRDHQHSTITSELEGLIVHYASASTQIISLLQILTLTAEERVSPCSHGLNEQSSPIPPCILELVAVCVGNQVNRQGNVFHLTPHSKLSDHFLQIKIQDQSSFHIFDSQSPVSFSFLKSRTLDIDLQIPPMANFFLQLSLLPLLITSLAAAASAPAPSSEKLTHIRFFWHDVVTGQNATAVTVTRPAAAATGFGMMVVIDDAMTEGPAITSKPVGRAQGFYLLAAQKEAALLMTMNLAFTDGEYNGSTLAVLGRNPVFNETRELSVVGGSGIFRLARGYAQLKTYSLEAATGNAVVEYNVYVLHN